MLRFGQGSAADVVVFLGPVSEFLGRARVLHYSFTTFFREYWRASQEDVSLTWKVLNFPVAFGELSYISATLDPG